MAKRRILLSALLALLFLAPLIAPVRADRLTVNMTEHEIAITSNFTGATITLFGAIQKLDQPTPIPHPFTLAPLVERQGPVEDIVVVIKGPQENITVRKKSRVAGIWVNTEAMTFRNAPGFYFVASTRPLADIVDEELRWQNEIGPTYLALTANKREIAEHSSEERRAFREALIRRKTAEGLYGVDETGVTLQDKTLFNMNLRIPANVPIGEYAAQIYLLRDGKIIGAQPLKPRVEKKGMEEWIYTIAHSIPYVYGVFAVAMACLAGWSAALIFRQK